jgi:uncharacterized protein
VRAVMLAALALVGAASLVPAAAADFKVPPAPQHFVTDTSALISSDTQAALESELHNYQLEAGHQVIVWIGDTTGGVPLETWTAETANAWKVGRKGRDDGAILFIFAKDHKVRIEVGYGLESSLTDADAHRIIAEDIVPRMKANDPDGAVTGGVEAMLATISPSYKLQTLTTAPAATPEPASSGLGTGIAIAVLVISCLTFAFFIFFVIMRIIGAIRYGYLVLREGSTKAKSDMKRSWLWGSAGFLGGVGSSGFSSGGGDDFGGGFSGGGGSFGGGGASGGW